MKWETFNFSNDFQDALLACVIRHPDEFFDFAQVLKPEHFTGPAAYEACSRLLKYVQQYGQYPSFSTLGNYAFHEVALKSVDHAKETLDYVEKLSKIDTKDWTDIRDRMVRFARERAVYHAILKIHAAQQEGKTGQIQPVEIIKEALSVGSVRNDPGISLYHDTGRVLDTLSSRDFGVMTGYAEFDKLWKTGWGPGWLIVLLAPPKRYKTAFAINLALNIVKGQDADVLYYSCEISEELAAMRAYYNLTGWTKETFVDNPEKGIMAAERAVTRDLWGNIWFKAFPSKSTTISQIKSHAHQVIDLCNLKPKAIVIDYAETVRPEPSDRWTPDRRQQAEIYTQARALGAEFGCCVIMPDRCNRETVGMAVPDMTSFQGSFEKAGIVDIAIGLCATEQEHIRNRIRYFVFLNRHGAAHKHYAGTVDPAKMRMTVDTEIEYSPDAKDEESDY